jgi:hypothetical protein
MRAVPKEQLGIASGLLSLSRMLGQLVGLPLTGTVFSLLTITRTPSQLNMDLTHAPIEALVFGMQMNFRIAALILLVATILATFLW